MGKRLRDWTRITSPWWNPNSVGRGGRNIIDELLQVHLANSLLVKSLSDPQSAGVTTLAKRVRSITNKYNHSPESVITLHELRNQLIAAKNKREARIKDLADCKATRGADDDFSQLAAKNYEQHEKGYWAGYYLTKAEELALLECLELDIFDFDNNNQKALSEARDKLADQEETIRKAARLALRKYKPIGTQAVFYTGKFAMAVTAIGAGISGATVAMFIATTFLGLPLAVAVIGAIIIFFTHFFLEIFLNRFTTARTMLQIFHIGIFDDVDKKNPDRHSRKKVIIPLVLSSGTAIQIGMLTATGTLTIFAGIASGTVLVISAVAFGILGFITIGTLLFHNSYKIYKAPEAWLKDNLDKLPQDQAEKALQVTLTMVAGLILFGAVMFYCYTIVLAVFAFCPPLGFILCFGLNLMSMAPFLITASFDVGKWMVEHMPNSIVDRVKAYPEHPTLAAVVVGFFAVVGLVFWLPAAAYKSLTKQAKDAKDFVEGHPKDIVDLSLKELAKTFKADPLNSSLNFTGVTCGKHGYCLNASYHRLDKPPYQNDDDDSDNDSEDNDTDALNLSYSTC